MDIQFKKLLSIENMNCDVNCVAATITTDIHYASNDESHSELRFYLWAYSKESGVTTQYEILTYKMLFEVVDSLPMEFKEKWDVIKRLNEFKECWEATEEGIYLEYEELGAYWLEWNNNI